MKHQPEESGANVVGRGVAEGYLPDEEIARIAREGLARLPVDGRRVLVLVPDGTRTMPMPKMFETIERELGPRVGALDFLIALGTHTPMSDAQLSKHLGQTVTNGMVNGHHIFNHRWDDPATFVKIGEIPAHEIAELTLGKLNETVPVALNRLLVDTTTSSSAARSFPTRSSASRAERSTCSPASRRRTSSISRTGSAP